MSSRLSGSRILAIGGAHLDRRGRLHGPHVVGASNPGIWHEEAGGGVFNAARMLAALGNSVRLISPRGGDETGDLVARAAAAAGLDDTPLIFLDRQTPTYTAILDADGNLVTALADMALYDVYGPRQIARRAVRDAIESADAVLTDANLPGETLTALGAACSRAGRPLFAIAISPAKAGRLRPVFDRLSCLFMNEAEATAVIGRLPGETMTWPNHIGAAGLSQAVVTRGSAAAILCDAGIASQLVPPPVGTIGDVTGAGDALAAGFIDARLNGASPQQALRAGVAMAGIVVRSASAVPETFARMNLDRAMALVPAPTLLA